jgi:hypothetical protein
MIASYDRSRGTLQETPLFCRRWFLIAIALAAFPHLWQPLVFAQQSSDSAGTAQIPSSPAKPVTEIPVQPAGDGERVAPSGPSVPAVKIPNFTSCPIAELQHTVRELAHLKADQDQSKLDALLDKIGDRTVESARKTPNLISHEAVVSEQEGVETRQNFSYLVLQHALGSNGVVLDEFRVDLKTGEKFQTEEIGRTEASNSLASSSSSLDLPSLRQSLPGIDSPPMSQGFGNNWLHFYPSNRSESTFRYLGEQQLNAHRTLVVAFAQKPGSVRLPALIAFENKTLPVYQQGVAWVDPSDFKIVRLRTDLLSPPAGVPLSQLTADIQFAEIRIAEIASPLWLPRQVVVTTNLGGVTLRETHTYSNYRLFRAHSKIRLNP